MCGRFALTLPKQALLHLFEAADGLPAALPAGMPGGDPVRARYNIRPTEAVLAVHLDREGGRALGAFRWGLLPRWSKSLRDGPPLINARGETVAEKPAFKESFLKRRCLIPADGFYEWRTLDGAGPKGKPLKQPHWIQARESNAPLAFAGVWRLWRSPEGEEIASVAIVTTAANQAMSALHDRLPVVIAPEDQALWLGEAGDATAALALIQAPAEDFFAHHPVSPRINKGGRAAPDDPDLIAPVPDRGGDASPPEQPSLL